MTVSNDTVSTAHDLGSHGAGASVVYTFESPPWDFDSDEHTLYGPLYPLGVCWVKVTFTEDLWASFQMPWFAGVTQDSSNEGNVSLNAWSPATAPATVYDLGTRYASAYDLSGGNPAPYVMSGVFPAGTYYIAVAYYDAATMSAVSAGETMELVLTTVALRDPSLSMTITPATSSDPHTYFVVHVDNLYPGEIPPGSDGTFSGTILYGDGFGRSLIRPGVTYNHIYSPNQIPSPSVTVSATLTDVNTSRSGSVSVVYPAPALPALPDDALLAEVRAEARLVPGIRMDGG